MVRLGVAGPDTAWLGTARSGKSRRAKAWRGEVGLVTVWQGMGEMGWSPPSATGGDYAVPVVMSAAQFGGGKTPDEVAAGYGSDPKTGLPNQRRMFMSANEILQSYGPIEGDRLNVNEEASYTPRTDDIPFRGRGSQGYGQTPGGRNYYRSLGNTAQKAVPADTNRQWVRKGSMQIEPAVEFESDEQLWDRKAEEASLSPEDYSAMRGQEHQAKWQRTGGASTENPGRFTMRSQDSQGGSTWVGHEEHPESTTSLRDRIVDEGVQSPVRLGETRNRAGMPEIVGGHHRLAVMREEKPDALMPVLHYPSIHEARADKAYRYT